MIVSACLLGVCCRYDGGHCLASAFLEELRGRDVIPVCPEQLGGLATPRTPAFLTGGDGFDVLDGRARVVTESGLDVTHAFVAGAEQVLKIASFARERRAFLKEKSPSCGVEFTTIDGRRKPGRGVTAALHARAGFTVTGIGGPEG